MGLLTALAIVITILLTSAVSITFAAFNGNTGNPSNRTGNQTLGTPTQAAPTVNGAGATATVGLSWTLPSGDAANQWVVMRGTGTCPPGSFSTINTVAVKSYSDSPNHGTFCYEIEGKLGNWTSQPSNQQSATVYQLPALIQKNHSETSYGASISATFSSNPVAGHLLVAIIGTYSNVVINLPSGWSSAINQSGTPSQAIFYKISVGSADKTVTVSAGSGDALGLRILEYSGVATASPLDTKNSATGTSSSPSSGSVTTAQSVELLVAGATLDASATTSAWSNSFTAELDGQSGGGSKADFDAADQIVYATGSYSTTATASRSGPWRGQIAAFKAAP